MAVQWTGLSEFKAALHDLPEDLKQEGAAIVLAHAQEAERLVTQAYPVRTTNLKRGPNRKSKWWPPGNLKKGVRTTVQSDARVGASALVRSTAPHAHLFERGTGVRRTGKGANRGRMPAADLAQQMIPIVIRVRRRMHIQLIHLLERAGLTVTQT
jgi:hypothetical protein